MIKAIIFDFDGVILESADLKTRAFHRLFVGNFPDKIDEILDFHRENMGISRFVKFGHIYKNILGLELSAEEEERLGKLFTKIVFEAIQEIPFVPGAYEFLEKNRGRYLTFVASGTPHEELKEIVALKQLDSFFAEIFGSPGTKVKIINNILERHCLAPHEVVFVGDALSDLRACEETGLYFVARVSNGHSLPCTYSIPDLRNFEEVLRKVG